MRRETTTWGVRLTTHPFEGLPTNSEMRISAEIRGSDIRFFFNGTTVRRPLKRADALIWMQQMRAIFDAAMTEKI